MRSTRLAISLLVLCAAGCAACAAAPQRPAHAPPAPLPAEGSPPPAMAPAPGAEAASEQPLVLSRHDTVLLFKKRDPTAIRDACARVGILYLTHGAGVTTPAAPAATLAPMKRLRPRRAAPRP